MSVTILSAPESPRDMFDLQYANDANDARRYRDDGYEPVACTFDKDDCVVGAYDLNHDSVYEWFEPFGVRAATFAISGVRLDRFVVTGRPSMEQSYAVAALSGAIEARITDATLIADTEDELAGHDLTQPAYHRILLFRHRNASSQANSVDAHRAIDDIISLYQTPSSDTKCDVVASPELKQALLQENERKKNARERLMMHNYERVALVESDAYDFDVWHETAPIIVRYAPSARSITIKLCTKKGPDLSEKNGFDLLGQTGFDPLYPSLDDSLGKGWCGTRVRATSPPNRQYIFRDAMKVYRRIEQVILGRDFV